MLNRGLNTRLGRLIGVVCVVLDYSEQACWLFHQLYNMWVAFCCSGFFFFKTNHCQVTVSGLVRERTRPTGHITLVRLFSLPSPNFLTIRLYFCHFWLFSLLQESNQWFDLRRKTILHWLWKSIHRITFSFHLFNWMFDFFGLSGSDHILGTKTSFESIWCEIKERQMNLNCSLFLPQ